MSSGSSNSSILNMPDYGQGLEEALRAQVGVLSGSLLEGDLKGRTLQEIVEQYERPLRMSSAQIDNDVLRQTLLGGQLPIYKSISQDDIVDRRASSDSQATQVDYGGPIKKTGEDAGKVVVGDGEIPDFVKDFSKLALELEEIQKTTPPDAQRSIQSRDKINAYKNKYSNEIRDKSFRATNGQSFNLYDYFDNGHMLTEALVFGPDKIKNFSKSVSDNYGIPDQIFKKNNDIDGANGAYEQYKQSGGNLSRSEWGNQDFVVPKDEDGNFILEATNETEVPVGGVAAPAGELTGYTRAGTGLVDMLGDTRNVQEFTTRQATEEDVAAGLASEVGESITEATGNRQAGFDADKKFLGLSALAEDIQRGNLSRQREADLADVERLSGRYSTLMDDFRPGTQQALTDASAVLEAQKDNLTGAGAITVPGGSTYSDSLTPGTMTAATVADPLKLSASTSYNPSTSVSGGTFDANTSYDAAQVADPMKLTAATSYDPSASVTGDGYTATAGLQGGNIGQDTFREALMAQATDALDNGLSERELASISNASRARSGMMGRTFDQQGAIDESKALVLEDQNRRMQNRAFAQSALGQETDIRERDLGRGLQASMQNQAALNRAAEFGASQDMQAQLANQAATNQALSQGLSAGLSQEALAAQQAQAKAMADATATNRASEFGVGAGMQQQAQANQAGLQAQLANQAASNQASQFGVGAGMEQDALRAQLGQQTSLAQAQMDQQANAFDADASQRAATVNQAQQQQANQFGVGATMDAQRLNEQLKQQGTLGYIDASTRLAALEDQYSLDPFAAILGRASGGSLQAGQGVFGQAGYGLNSGPQYLNPEAGLGYISQMAANDANMYAANVSANATRDAGMMSMIGGIGGGLLGNSALF